MTTELETTEFNRGFELAWSAVSDDYRRAFGELRADILGSLFNNKIHGEPRAQILKALNGFQDSSDWEFDVD